MKDATMNEDVNNRLNGVEVWQASAEERFKTLFRIVGEHNEALRENTKTNKELSCQVSMLSTQIAVLISQNSTRKDCPAPGMCRELEPRIAELEKKESAFVGSWKGIAFVFSCAAAFIAAAGGVIGIIKLCWNRN